MAKAPNHQLSSFRKTVILSAFSENLLRSPKYTMIAEQWFRGKYRRSVLIHSFMESATHSTSTGYCEHNMDAYLVYLTTCHVQPVYTSVLHSPQRERPRWFERDLNVVSIRGAGYAWSVVELRYHVLFLDTVSRIQSQISNSWHFLLM